MEGFPKITKNGAISTDGGEATPFLYKGRMVMLENLWGGTPDLKAFVRLSLIILQEHI